MSASPAAALRTRARAARRILLAALACAMLASGAAFAADPARTLRIAQFDLDTLDPQQYTDDPSFQVVQALFEPAYEWDYLAKVPTLTPLTAAALPEVTDEGRVWIVRLQRGILFHDDPVFKGKPRELTADDYVYAYKRWLDPNGRRGGAPILTGLIVGAREVVDAARKDGRFDFDRPIEGLRSLDRYTLRIALREPNYPNVRELISFVGALPREVVDDAKGDIRTRPVGTGPYRLKEWKRGSRVVLVAHSGYREAGFPASRDPADASLVAAMKGKRVPFAGTVEISIVDEDITRLLLFEKGDIDFVQLRGEIATRLTRRRRQAQARVRGPRHRAPRLRRAVPVLDLLQPQGPGDRRHGQRPGGAAARRRDVVGRGHGDQGGARGRRHSGRPAHSARRRRARSCVAGEVDLRPRRPRTRCSTASATASATARASASRPTARR